MAKSGDEAIEKIVFNPEEVEFHSSCAEGLHEFLEAEVKAHGLTILASNRGGVFFRGRKEKLQKFLFSTRFSSRVAFSIFKTEVDDADDLYEQCLELPWEKILPPGASFKIDSFTRDSLNDSRFALYRLKDAIRDRLRDEGKPEPGIDKDEPDILFLLRSNRDSVNVQISVSSLPLNKRGYREDSLEAPIRENIAQALLQFSGWKPGEVLIDPMCGSGTILIEAALLLKDSGAINSNLLKRSIAYEMLFGKSFPSAGEFENPKEISLFGYDYDPKAVRLAKENAAKAGVERYIQFAREDVLRLKNTGNWKSGFIVTNPPYGERMGDKEMLKGLYADISASFKKEFPNFYFSVISGDKSLPAFFRLKEDKSMNIAIAKMKGKFARYKLAPLSQSQEA